MVTKLLFWGSVLSMFLGVNAREGDLFFFFGTFFFMSATGFFFRGRENKAGKRPGAEALPSPDEPS